MKLKKLQGRTVAKKVREKYGEITETNANYTLQRISKMKPFLCGLSKQEVRNFLKDESYPGILSKISESKCLKRGLVWTFQLFIGFFINGYIANYRKSIIPMHIKWQNNT